MLLIRINYFVSCFQAFPPVFGIACSWVVLTCLSHIKRDQSSFMAEEININSHSVNKLSSLHAVTSCTHQYKAYIHWMILKIHFRSDISVFWSNKCLSLGQINRSLEIYLPRPPWKTVNNIIYLVPIIWSEAFACERKLNDLLLVYQVL